MTGIVCSLIVLTMACNDATKMDTSRTNILNIDTVVHPDDSILTDEYNRRVLIKYHDSKKVYVGEYANSRLNGRIEIYDGQPYPHTVGHMNQNKPEGIWLFVDKNKTVDSARIIHNGETTNIDKTLFRFDTVALAAGNSNFNLKKPVSWGLVTDSSNNNLGVIEPPQGDEFQANIILSVDTFAEKKDFAFAVDYLAKFLQKSYQSIKVVSEGYYSNNLGTYYQLDLECSRNNKRLLLVASLFINNNELYTLLATSKYNSQQDYYLYSWMFRDIASSLSLR